MTDRTPTTEQVLAFEAFMRERFGIEVGVAADGTHFYERWQIDEAFERIRAGERESDARRSR